MKWKQAALKHEAAGRHFESKNSKIQRLNFDQKCAIIAPCCYFENQIAQFAVLENKEYLNAES